jgi:hypothetical protein
MFLYLSSNNGNVVRCFCTHNTKYSLYKICVPFIGKTIFRVRVFVNNSFLGVHFGDIKDWPNRAQMTSKPEDGSEEEKQESI